MKYRIYSIERRTQNKICFVFKNLWFILKNLYNFVVNKSGKESKIIIFMEDVKKEEKKVEKLTKVELISKISEIVELSKNEVNVTINALVSIIISEMQIGHEITIPGLGTFTKHNRAERIATNPLTGQKIKIPSKNVPKFKPAKNLKDAVGLTQ